MAAEKNFGHGGELKDDQIGLDATTSPKYHKKESKGYIAFHSDDDESSDLERCEEEFRSPKERKKIKKDRSNTFKKKFKSIQVKKKEKEGKEKTKEKEKENKEKSKEKDKDRDKEEKKEKEKKKKHKRSYSSGAVLVHTPPSAVPAEPIFGAPLEVAVARSKFPDGVELPRIVRECIQYIEEKGLDQEGIFRVSGIKSKIDEIKMLYDQGKKVDFEGDDIEPNLVAGLLKLYLRELPCNILTARLLAVFDGLIGVKDEQEKLEKYKQLLAELPLPNRTLLGWLFTLLGHIMDRSHETKMNIQNVSIVFSPTMNISHGVLFVFMKNIKELFPDVQMIKYVEPEKPPAAVESSDIGQSISSLEDEFRQQEIFLDYLHEKINKGKESENEEDLEEMWEVQRRVTQVKRKLKALKKAKAKEERENLEKENLESEIKEKNKQQEVEHKEEQQSEVKEKSDEQNLDQGKDDSKQQNRESEQSSKEEINTSIDTLEEPNADTEQPPEEQRQKEQEVQDQSEPQENKKGQPQQQQEVSRSVEQDITQPVAEPQTENREIEQQNETEQPEKDIPIPEPQATIDVDKRDSLEQEGKEEEEESSSDEENDEELQELLREELRLNIEQEELLAVSEYLKNRVRRENRDIERLQQAIDGLRKRKDYSSPISSSDDDSSSESGSESATESDEDDSELENILKELEKENERLENQTLDLVKSLAEERERCVHLRTEIRFIELDQKNRAK